MTVTLSLTITGKWPDAPRWTSSVHSSWAPSSFQRCCGDGHLTPEAAADHGAVLAARWLSHYARSTGPGTCGAEAIAILEGTAA